MSKKHLLVTASIFVFTIAFNVESHGFNIGNFGKILENVTGGSTGLKQPAAPSTNESEAFSQSSNESGSGSSSVSSLNCTNWGIIKPENICSSFIPDDEWLKDANKTKIRSLENSVAGDFGKSGQKGRAETQTELSKIRGDGLKWGQSLGLYKEGFNGSVIKLLFKNFLDDPQRRLELAGKIKHAITHDDLEEIEQNDARFAYALILAHFNKIHVKQAYQEKILQEAFQGDSLGAVYVVGSRLFYGTDGVRQDVKKAAGVLTTTDGWKNQEEDEWKELMDLWYIVAVDPRNPYHQQNQSFAADAARAKAKMERRFSKARKSNTAMSVHSARLTRYRMKAGELLSEAFGYASKQAELTEHYQDLLNQGKSSQQVVKTTVNISLETIKLANKMIGQTNKELDPAGKAKLKRARDINICMLSIQNELLVSAAFKTISMMGNIDSLMSSGIQMVGELDDSKEASCKLHNSLTTFAEKKNIKVGGKPIKPMKEEDSMFTGQ